MTTQDTIDTYKLLSEPFPEEDVEWRLARCGKQKTGKIWASCLAYISARAIQDRLDEVIGPNNWSVRYRVLSGDKIAPGLICELSLRVGEEWITKEDGAEQTDIESFKGGISSAFKRAAVLFGIGRYLYKLESGFAQIVEDKKGAYQGKGFDLEKKEFYFNWLPPKLPNWALPPEKRTQDHERMKVFPEQPKSGDGVMFEDFHG